MIGKLVERLSPPSISNELPDSYTFADGTIVPQPLNLGVDEPKIAHMFGAAGLGAIERDLSLVRLHEDLDRLPKHTRRQVERGDLNGIVVTHSDRRTLFGHPLGKSDVNELNIYLGGVLNAMFQNKDVLDANQSEVDIDNTRERVLAVYQGREPVLRRSAYDSLEASIQQEMDRQVAEGTRQLAHQRWHHRSFHRLYELTTGFVVAQLAKLPFVTVDNRIPNIPIWGPVNTRNITVFLAGLASVWAYRHTIGDFFHRFRADRKTAAFMEKFGNERVITVSLGRGNQAQPVLAS